MEAASASMRMAALAANVARFAVGVRGLVWPVWFQSEVAKSGLEHSPSRQTWSWEELGPTG